jgi:hypothetical protein
MAEAELSTVDYLEIVNGLTSRSARHRRKPAGMLYIWDSWGSIDEYAARSLAPIIAWAALVEEDRGIREDLLNALQLFTIGDRVSLDVLEFAVSGISRADLGVSEMESISALEEKIHEYRDRQV